MNVLSLFDGMSCGQIALRELDIKVDKYYASEIDKFAITQTKLNFPETIQLGDVSNWVNWDIDFASIDLIMAGSPCQGFSFAGKQLAFDDPRSKLFFVFIEILNHCKNLNANVKFLLENVDMKRSHMAVISQYCGVFPVNINSNLVSAQNRNRWYWSNIRTKKVGLFGEVHTDIPQPEDKGILLQDILENEVDEKYYLTTKALEYLRRAKEERTENVKYCTGTDKSSTITCNYRRGVHNGGESYVKISPKGRIKKDQGKSSCLTGAGGHGAGNHSDMDLICTSSNSWEQNNLLSGERIRRLTPTECSRLQTVPDWYKWDCSDTQIYKMCGNGWTVDVIAHILSFFKNTPDIGNTEGR